MKKRKKRLKKKFKILLLFVLAFGTFFIIFNRETNFLDIIKDEISDVIYKEPVIDTLVLVNKENKIPDEYSAYLVDYSGYQVSKAMLSNLIELFDEASSQEIPLKINNSYRSREYQEKLYNDSISKYLNKGYSENNAIKQTLKTILEPGYSEHETGLAIDFSNPSHSVDNSVMWQYLYNNAYKYGFILRYPKDKTDITKISYEPWHYRYVGIEHSTYMYENNLVLEEYLDYLKQEKTSSN